MRIYIILNEIFRFKGSLSHKKQNFITLMEILNLYENQHENQHEASLILI